MLTAWNKMTGITGERVFSYSDDPELQTEAKRNEWLEWRKKGIGGSDIAAIAGCNPFESAIDLYLKKTGRLQTEENEKMKWGKLLEPAVSDAYAVSKSVKVLRVNAILQHPGTSHFLVNLDRMITKNGHLTDDLDTHQCLKNIGNGVLEVKCTAWEKAWTGDEVPDFYYCQGQWEMFVSGLRWMQFSVLINGNNHVNIPPILYNESAANNLAELADRFWSRHVLADTPPPVSQSPADYDAIKLLYPDRNDKVTVELSESLNALIADRIRIADNIKIADDQKKIIDAKVLENIQNANCGVTSKYKVTKVLKSMPSFQTSKFKEECPDLYTKYLTSSNVIYPLYKTL